ncbi:hypothetical protein A8709_25820 [Paenibacillus pectinilyticus]|uniref:Prepilin-type N-terminal cleavage/methylation domain-containing protein n=1 Tax=Paenibacillus pectinilyticus TaxID=512399 RepID=A0A1C1A143_9BACL|nr:prepilin-type N-terminal cleavage/methylation domain-containing protein [Paenibacillus pectinilyticus]OCT14252.1 hypothetical protein A8709_25820 [Paenibacillus pectinilyticus]
MKKKEPRDEGFTLIEVLAATVILSVVSLAMMAFFIQAMSYNKGNQNKTVMVNLARNALFYMEKQPFTEMNDYLKANGGIDLEKGNCSMNAGALICSPTDMTISSMTGLWDVFNPEVNGKQYEVTVKYQSDLIHEELEMNPTSTKFQYLIPISVQVVDKNAPNPSSRYQADVEGYILDESIR